MLPDTPGQRVSRKQLGLGARRPIRLISGLTLEQQAAALGHMQGSGNWDKPYEWDIAHWIPRASVGFIGGQSASGKTFAVIEMIGGLISGKKMFARLIVERTGIVIYCSIEGKQGLDHRFEAWRQLREVPRDIWDSRLIRTTRIFNFDNADTRVFNEYIRQTEEKYAGKVVLVVFDTLRNFGNIKEENSSSDAQHAIAYGREIADMNGCSVLFVHHSGKANLKNKIEVGCDFDRLLRGSSDFGSSAEFVLGVAQGELTDGKRIPWIWPAKVKDAEKPDPIPMPIESYALTLSSGEIQSVGVVANDIDPLIKLVKSNQSKSKSPTKIDLEADRIESWVYKSNVPVNQSAIRSEVVSYKSQPGGMTTDGAKGMAQKVLERLKSTIDERKIYMDKEGLRFFRSNDFEELDS